MSCTCQQTVSGHFQGSYFHGYLQWCTTPQIDTDLCADPQQHLQLSSAITEEHSNTKAEGKEPVLTGEASITGNLNAIHVSSNGNNSSSRCSSPDPDQELWGLEGLQAAISAGQYPSYFRDMLEPARPSCLLVTRQASVGSIDVETNLPDLAPGNCAKLATATDSINAEQQPKESEVSSMACSAAAGDASLASVGLPATAEAMRYPYLSTSGPPHHSEQPPRSHQLTGDLQQTFSMCTVSPMTGMTGFPAGCREHEASWRLQGPPKQLDSTADPSTWLKLESHSSAATELLSAAEPSTGSGVLQTQACTTAFLSTSVPWAPYGMQIQVPSSNLPWDACSASTCRHIQQQEAAAGLPIIRAQQSTGKLMSQAGGAVAASMSIPVLQRQLLQFPVTGTGCSDDFPAQHPADSCFEPGSPCRAAVETMPSTPPQRTSLSCHPLNVLPGSCTPMATTMHLEKSHLANTSLGAPTSLAVAAAGCASDPKRTNQLKTPVLSPGVHSLSGQPLSSTQQMSFKPDAAGMFLDPFQSRIGYGAASTGVDTLHANLLMRRALEYGPDATQRVLADIAAAVGGGHTGLNEAINILTPTLRDWRNQHLPGAEVFWKLSSETSRCGGECMACCTGQTATRMSGLLPACTAAATLDPLRTNVDFSCAGPWEICPDWHQQARFGRTNWPLASSLPMQHQPYGHHSLGFYPAGPCIPAGELQGSFGGLCSFDSPDSNNYPLPWHEIMQGGGNSWPSQDGEVAVDLQLGSMLTKDGSIEKTTATETSVQEKESGGETSQSVSRLRGWSNRDGDLIEYPGTPPKTLRSMRAQQGRGQGRGHQLRGAAVSANSGGARNTAQKANVHQAPNKEGVKGV